MIRVLLVDDQYLFTQGMRMLLSLEGDMQVVGEATDGRSAVEQAAALKPDVVLMDIEMAGMNGVEATRRIRQLLPQTRVLVLSTYDDDSRVVAALLEGAAGYLTKDLPAEEISAAIRRTLEGGVITPPAIAAKVVAVLARREAAAPEGDDQRHLAELTEREREVLGLVGLGYSNAEVGIALTITQGTARNHVSNIIQKLGLRDRTQAAVWAMRHGLTQR